MSSQKGGEKEGMHAFERALSGRSSKPPRTNGASAAIVAKWPPGRPFLISRSAFPIIEIAPGLVTHVARVRSRCRLSPPRRGVQPSSLDGLGMRYQRLKHQRHLGRHAHQHAEPNAPSRTGSHHTICSRLHAKRPGAEHRTNFTRRPNRRSRILPRARNCRPYPSQCAVGGAVFAIDGRAAMRSNHVRSVG